MQMEQLFSRGIMQMGPSRVDPQRQVGMFNPGFVAGLPYLRAAENIRQRGTRQRWLLGLHRRMAIPPKVTTGIQ